MGDSPNHKKSRINCTDLDLFDEVFPILVQDLTQNGLKDEEISDAMQWFKTVCEYNVPHGKKNRGLTVVHSYDFLLKERATEDGRRLARILGWCIELLQAFFLVLDDIMDYSITRRGRPCWYKKDDVGLIAINDAIYLESAIYVILKKYFRSSTYYVDLLELFHQTTLQTVIGQCLDLITSNKEVDFSHYTLDRYMAIVKWKTAYYSFYLPVACAMFMAGITDQESHSNAKSILLKMGEYFQIQDDYLDCYGDPEVTGKIGTDIEDNKCGWLIVQALDRCGPQQRLVLQENYAQQDGQKVGRVKAVYNELNLKEVFSEYETTSYNELMTLIDKLSGSLPREMFIAYAKKIYKRNK